MTTPVFPDGLPNPSLFSWVPSQQVIPSPNEGAARYARRISREPSAEAEIVWQFTSDHSSTFWSWWKIDLLNGHRWFLADIPSAVGIRTQLIRFVSHPKRSAIGHGYTKVEAKIEVLNRRIQTEIIDLYVTSTLYPVLGFDSLTASFSVRSASFRSPTQVLESMIPSFEVQSGSLAVLLKSTDVLDSLIPSFQIQSGTLATILISYDRSVEAVQPTLTLQSATLQSLLISNVIPAEGLDIGFAVISASLT